MRTVLQQDPDARSVPSSRRHLQRPRPYPHLFQQPPDPAGLLTTAFTTAFTSAACLCALVRRWRDRLSPRVVWGGAQDARALGDVDVSSCVDRIVEWRGGAEVRAGREKGGGLHRERGEEPHSARHPERTNGKLHPAETCHQRSACLHPPRICMRVSIHVCVSVRLVCVCVCARARACVCLLICLIPSSWDQRVCKRERGKGGREIKGGR